MSKLSVDLRVGETLTIGGALVRLEKKSGQLARLTIEADESVAIKPPGRSRANKSATQECCQPQEQHNG